MCAPSLFITIQSQVVKKQFKAALKKKPWNETDASQFCDGQGANKTANCTLYNSLMNTLEKYVFFATEQSVVKSFTPQESYIIKNNAKDIPVLMQQAMQRCKEMILACYWQGKAVDCMQLFQVRRTDNGFCCSFNTVNIDEQL